MNMLLVLLMIGAALLITAWVWAIVEGLANSRSVIPDALGGLGLLFWAWLFIWVVLSLGGK